MKLSAISAIREGRNRYTPTQGCPELVQALSRHLTDSVGGAGRSLLVTCGVSGGLALAFAALINPGDEVLMADPYFVIYRHMVTLMGGVPVPVDTYPDFRLTAARLEAAVTDRSKLILVGSPANPTGVVSTAEELEQIAELAARRDLLIISDEIYSVFSYDGPAPSMARLYGPSLLLSGFSKSHAAPGWRIGYAWGPSAIIAEMGKLQQYTFVCAPAPAQHAIAENLDIDTRPVTDGYRRKRDLMCAGLTRKYEFAEPGGAFYVFPKAPWGTGTQFVEEAIRNNLLAIPGGIFSQRDTHFRISYATDDETIRRGVEILNRLA